MENKVIELSKTKFMKMIFLYNALESGWTVIKKENSFILTKKHEDSNEILEECNLSTFMKEKLELNEILS